MPTYTIPETYQKYDKHGSVMWIHFVAREFEKQTGYGRSQSSIRTGKELKTWKILAPTEIMENVSHDWGEYESLGSRIAQKMGEIKTSINEAKGLASTLKQTITGGMSNTTARGIVGKIASGAAGVKVPKFKVDTSMVYQDTKRREYTFVFNFAVTGKGPEKEVFEPIREMQKLSCAEIGGENALIDIKFPAIFKVYSEPSNIIKINHAALTAVQPTWKAPYKNGYPISCELQVRLMDIEPLYRRSFEEGGIIRTSKIAPVQ